MYNWHPAGHFLLQAGVCGSWFLMRALGFARKKDATLILSMKEHRCSACSSFGRAAHSMNCFTEKARAGIPRESADRAEKELGWKTPNGNHVAVVLDYRCRFKEDLLMWQLERYQTLCQTPYDFFFHTEHALRTVRLGCLLGFAHESKPTVAHWFVEHLAVGIPRK